MTYKGNFEPIASSAVYGGEPSFAPETLSPAPPNFPAGLLPGSERPRRNTEPSGADDFRAALTPGFKVESTTPEAPILLFGALWNTPIERLQHATFSSLWGWIVRYGDLGDIGTLVGLISDADEAVEPNVFYVLIDLRVIARTEQALGSSLEKVFETGEKFEIVHRSQPLPRCLVALTQMPSVETYSCGPRFASLELLDAQREHRADFSRRRDAALALKARWSIDRMTSRESWPDWLPDFIKKVIREKSATWLSLPDVQPPPQSASSNARLGSGEVTATPKLGWGIVADGVRKLCSGFIDS